MNSKKLVLLLLLASVCGVTGTYARHIEFRPVLEGADGGIQMPVAACLQYQRIKSARGNGYAPFRKYGFHPIAFADSTKRLWGYHVYRDSTYNNKKPLYRIFKKHDLRSFAIIENSDNKGTSQYVFWWKGYYRNFVAELRQMGFDMSNVSGKTNVLRFSRKDISIVVDFIIWEDLYVMEIKDT